MTLASGPSFSSKKIAAIGLTYSCEKRQSVRKKPLSPGWTHGTPVSPLAASVTSLRAKIFSASHRPRPAADLALDRRELHLALEPRDVVLEQPAVLDDLLRDGIDVLRELRERDLLAPANPLDQREVRRGQDPEVLAVFVVDPLDVLGDDDADPGHELGVGRLLAATPLPPSLAAHRADEAAVLDAAAGDRELVAGLEPQVRELSERLVEVVADVGGRDLVGRDLVPELGAQLLVPLQFLAF